MTVSKNWFRIGLAGAFALAPFAALADATDPSTIDYVAMFKTRILPCLHPTVSVDKATVEVQKAPAKAGDVTTTRIAAFYPGLLKKNALQADIMVRQSGSIRQIQVNVLSDTSSLHGSCDLTKNWVDF